MPSIRFPLLAALVLLAAGSPLAPPASAGSPGPCSGGPALGAVTYGTVPPDARWSDTPLAEVSYVFSSAPGLVLVVASENAGDCFVRCVVGGAGTCDVGPGPTYSLLVTGGFGAYSIVRACVSACVVPS